MLLRMKSRSSPFQSNWRRMEQLRFTLPSIAAMIEVRKGARRIFIRCLLNEFVRGYFSVQTQDHVHPYCCRFRSCFTHAYPSCSSSSLNDDEKYVDGELAPSSNLLKNKATIVDFIQRLRNASSFKSSCNENHASLCLSLTKQYDAYLKSCQRNNPFHHETTLYGRSQILSSETVVVALNVLRKAQSTEEELVPTLRLWERILGDLNETLLTDHLSLTLLRVNAQFGQVRRVLALLKLRRDRKFAPAPQEFEVAIRSIRVAQRLHVPRNIFLSDAAPKGDTTNKTTTVNTAAAASFPSSSSTSSPLSERKRKSMSKTPHANVSVSFPLDNPTRWLDAIVMNMKVRGERLTSRIAAKMLSCYASGYTGRASHHFYRVRRRPLTRIENGELDSIHKQNDNANYDYKHMPLQYYWDRESQAYVAYRTKVYLHFNTCSPPFYKVPSLVGRRALNNKPPYASTTPVTTMALSTNLSDSTNSDDSQTSLAGKVRSKLELELDPLYSPGLNAAFTFASSLNQGAMGHQPLRLDVDCLNALVMTCVQRGALWRAMEIIDSAALTNANARVDRNKSTEHPASASSPSTQPTFDPPTIVTYNILLNGLARVGDIRTMQDYTSRILSAGLKPDSFTVRTIVTGLLNLGDVGSAITVVQDFFNQHSILPPVTTLITILEHSLARDLLFEAKRYVAFMRQLRKWTPHPTYHSPSWIHFMEREIKTNPQLQRPALEAMFAYFGYQLQESDFF